MIFHPESHLCLELPSVNDFETLNILKFEVLSGISENMSLSSGYYLIYDDYALHVVAIGNYNT